ncbi:MAG: hypothetical protein GF353_14880 [Candidatus Lokiarchaeota archaeon]|nr:hypothetical protein [Candidatus Lokiarchaeota archaeon]
MNKPYIFAHRGAMAYCIENTMESFQKAVEMRVGIETDLRLTRDMRLICFHDPGFKIDDQWYFIKDLTYEELKDIEFEDGREVPTFEEILNAFRYCPKEFRYSCDIGNAKVGYAAIDIIKKFNNFHQVEITDTRLWTLKKLRKYSLKIKLIHTIPYQIKEINQDTIKFDKLRDYNINILNIKNDRATKENFKAVVDYGFKCYVWGVNSKNRMKKVLKLRYDEEFPRAIYTNYPDVLKKIRDKIYD